ncbi:putative sulfoacetate transporter SauU [Dyadobacter sp. CECT 9275]|uniref:Sulfoacetate transporter SauU n=1 Tax=Dyadobacter helix TaxID=2822344 RepID=A0A916JF07_9BACT|nr:MFS transporter [Dyadobacter sp. CECT 9275]CAG5002366.1 putative sulfoacetate transporter SauU [Dyadobacter sp. CECT 9275]
MSTTETAPLKAEYVLPSGAWRVVVLLCFVGCLNYLDRTMITTMRTSIIQAMPMTDAQFGLLTSVFLWVYGILSPFAGFLADHFNRSRVIIISLFVWSAVTWLTAYCTSFEQLLATRVLMGISEACYIPAALALIVDYHKTSTRSLASGIHIAGIMVGQSLGFVGGWIAEKQDWSAPFGVFGVVGVVYSFILLWLLKDAPKTGQPQEKKQESEVHFFTALKSLFSQGSFLLLILFWSLLGIIGWMVMGWMPTYYEEHFNLSQGMAGLYATGYLYPASIAGVILGGFLTDRFSRGNSISTFLVPVIGLCIAAPAIFIASNTTVLPLAITMFMFYGLTRMFSDANIMPILCLIADVRYRATGYGVINLFACVIGGLGLYAGGVLRDMDVDLGKIFQSAALLMVVCIGLLYLIRRGVNKKSEEI